MGVLGPDRPDRASSLRGAAPERRIIVETVNAMLATREIANPTKNGSLESRTNRDCLGPAGSDASATAGGYANLHIGLDDWAESKNLPVAQRGTPCRKGL